MILLVSFLGKHSLVLLSLLTRSVIHIVINIHIRQVLKYSPSLTLGMPKGLSNRMSESCTSYTSAPTISNKHGTVRFPPCTTLKVWSFQQASALISHLLPWDLNGSFQGQKVTLIWHSNIHFHSHSTLPIIPCICRLYKEIPPLSIQHH